MSKLFSIPSNRSNIIPVNNIKELVVNILKNIVPNPYIYVENKYLPIWTKAFTHETYNPTDNYEDEEYLGDRVLKIVFPKYLSTRYPEYNRKDLSNVDMLVMEKKNQYDLAFELGLINFILIPHSSKIPIGVGGDIFESFFGALDRVGDLVSQSTGIILCYNLITYIFNQNNIPDYLRLGSSKMIVEQIFRQLTPTLQIYTKINKTNKQFNIELILNKEQLQFFKQHNIILNSVIGTATGFGKNPTISKAFEMAHQYLISKGVNEDFIKKVKTTSVTPEEIKIENTYPLPITEITTLILSPIIKNKNVLDQIVNNKIWDKVFYEMDDDLVYFGEVSIKGLVAKWLLEVYKNQDYNKEDFNNIMSNISVNYNLFLNTYPYSYLKNDLILKMFLGALDKVSSQLLYGSGFINVYNLIKLIFINIPYDFRFKHPKTEAEQLLSPLLGQQLSKFHVDFNYDKEKEINTYILTLTPEQANYLNHYFTIKSNLLAKVEGRNKKETEKQAYQLALDYLKTIGVTREWVSELKNKLEFKDLPYTQELEKKRVEDGFDYFYFASPTKTYTQTHYTIQLVGVKGNNKTILSHLIVASDNDKMDAKIQLLLNYINI